MSWTFLIYGMVPLIAFVVVDALAGLRWAVISATAFALVDVLITYYTTGLLDYGLVAGAVLVLGLGVYALRRNDPFVFKMQPVVLGVLLAAFVAYHQIFGPPLTVVYLSFFEKALPPDQQGALHNPDVIALMNAMVNGLVPVFLIHAVLVWLAAKKMGNVAWLVMRGVGFWLLLVIMAVGVGAARYLGS